MRGNWMTELDRDALDVEGPAALELGSWRQRRCANDIVTTVEGRPWVHVHRLFAHEIMLGRGFGVAELVCHACDTGLFVAHMAMDRTVTTDLADPPQAPVGPQAVRDLVVDLARFHGGCSAGGGRAKLYRAPCSSTRLALRVIDLRGIAAAAAEAAHG